MTMMKMKRGKLNRFRMRREGEGQGGQAGAMGMGGAGASQQQIPANPGSNQGGQSQTGDQSGNNAGQGFDPGSFWNTPAPVAATAPFTGSAVVPPVGAGTTQGQQQTDPGAQLGATIRERMGALAFQPVFTPDIATQLGEGNFNGANQALQQVGAHAVSQAVEMSVMVMQQYGQHLQQQMEQRFQQLTQNTFNQRDNNSALESEFPLLAGNPGMRPQVEGILNQAMQHTRGDRKAAIEMTKGMLQFMGQGLQQQFGGFGEAPYDPQGQGPSSLVEELLSRR